MRIKKIFSIISMLIITSILSINTSAVSFTDVNFNNLTHSGSGNYQKVSWTKKSNTYLGVWPNVVENTIFSHSVQPLLLDINKGEEFTIGFGTTKTNSDDDITVTLYMCDTFGINYGITSYAFGLLKIDSINIPKGTKSAAKSIRTKDRNKAHCFVVVTRNPSSPIESNKSQMRCEGNAYIRVIK